MTRKILTLTLNPALDISASVDEIVIGPKLRCEGGQFSAGGGGVNASRAIRILGGHCETFVAVGGHIGELLVQQMQKAGIAPILYQTNGQTRQNITVDEKGSNQQLRVVLPGPDWSQSCQSGVLPRIMEHVTPDTWVVASGSLPKGMPTDFYIHLNKAVTQAGARLILDTSNHVLRQSVSGIEHPYEILRMDQQEAEELAGKSFPTHCAEADFAQDLVNRGITGLAILARGAEGSIFATADDRFMVRPPKTPVQSKVGAGDSFVGALALSLSAGTDLREAAIFATSTAASTVQTPARHLCEPAMVETLVKQCVLEPL